MSKTIITIMGEEVTVYLSNYQKGNANALQLFSVDDGYPFATASVNVGELEPDEVAIKDYSENEGILAELVAENVIEKPHRTQESKGFTAPVCRITKEFLP